MYRWSSAVETARRLRRAGRRSCGRPPRRCRARVTGRDHDRRRAPCRWSPCRSPGLRARATCLGTRWPAHRAARRPTGAPHARTARSSTSTWSAARASSRWWVENTTVVPAARSSTMDAGDALLSRRVESGDRFVEEQQPRLGSERLGDADPLLLASRQLAERPARSSTTSARSTAESIASWSDGPRLPTSPSATVATHAHHFVDGERDPAVVVVLLGDERRATPPGDCRSCRQLDRQRGEGVEQGGLAAAVGPDEGRDAGRHQFERGPVEGDVDP